MLPSKETKKLPFDDDDAIFEKRTISLEMKMKMRTDSFGEKKFDATKTKITR